MKTNRKVWSLLLVVAMVVSCLSGYERQVVAAENVAIAQIASTADLQYEVNPDGTAVITKYVGRTDGEWTRIALPSEIDGHKVTEVRGTFEGLSMQWVFLPTTVKIIGSYTFKNCGNLVNISTYDDSQIVTGGSVATSGGAVSGASIGTVSFDTSLFTDADNTFAKTSNTYFAADSITKICSYAFERCDNIHNYRFPASLSQIESYAFVSAQNMNYVDFSDTCLTTIPSYAFKDCNNVHRIDLPETLVTIQSFAFYSCDNLNDMGMPATMSSIGASAFSGCQNLHNITVPEGITKIESNTFEGCQNLNNVVLPDSLKEISDGAFSGCNNIHNINIDSDVKVSANSGLNYKPAPTVRPTQKPVKVTVKKTKIKKLKAVKVKKKKKKVRGVQIKWKKVKGVSGYMIYRKVGKKKFKLIKTIKKAKKVKYVDTKKIKKKKKYTYKIVTFKVVNGITYYGKASKTKKIKIKK